LCLNERVEFLILFISQSLHKVLHRIYNEQNVTCLSSFHFLSFYFFFFWFSWIRLWFFHLSLIVVFFFFFFTFYRWYKQVMLLYFHLLLTSHFSFVLILIALLSWYVRMQLFMIWYVLALDGWSTCMMYQSINLVSYKHYSFALLLKRTKIIIPFFFMKLC
jgi:hypothetical protein